MLTKIPISVSVKLLCIRIVFCKLYNRHHLIFYYVYIQEFYWNSLHAQEDDMKSEIDKLMKTAKISST